MRICFLRHATASDIAPSDDVRELTGLGREESRIAGAALARGLRPVRILASPLTRAMQTAEIAGKGLKFRRFNRVDRRTPQWRFDPGFAGDV